jgi:hypothetical protein
LDRSGNTLSREYLFDLAKSYSGGIKKSYGYQHRA